MQVGRLAHIRPPVTGACGSESPMSTDSPEPLRFNSSPAMLVRYEDSSGSGSVGTQRRQWSNDEDETVRELVRQHGTRAWTLVASHLTGRTGKQCRERCASSPTTAGQAAVVELRHAFRRCVAPAHAAGARGPLRERRGRGRAPGAHGCFPMPRDPALAAPLAQLAQPPGLRHPEGCLVARRGPHAHRAASALRQSLG